MKNKMLTNLINAYHLSLQPEINDFIQHSEINDYYTSLFANGRAVGCADADILHTYKPRYGRVFMPKCFCCNATFKQDLGRYFTANILRCEIGLRFICDDCANEIVQYKKYKPFSKRPGAQLELF